MKKKKVLLIGWDAADWQIINPLMAEGKMPTLQKFLSESASGNIATLDPPYSPMLWTSIATGKHAFDHGVLGFTELLPDGSGVRPISAHSRKVKAIWNILNQEGYKSNVVGWWPSNPVENINGVMVSNFYQHARTKYDEAWPLLDGTINSEEHRQILADLRLHPEELTGEHLYPFIPNLKKLDVEKDKVLPKAAKILAQASSIHNACTYLMAETEWDFMAVYHDAIDHMCHLAMKYRAPKLEGIADTDFENYRDLVDGMYRFHDMMLERLLALVDENTYVMLVSDHGFNSDSSRLIKIPFGPATPALEHRPYGIFAIRGPGIKPKTQIMGASVLDVTPTLLHIFGLPVGRDMAGNIAIQAFANTPNPNFIPSWETREGNAAMLEKNATSDPIAEQQALEQLIELGYVEKQSEKTEKQIIVTSRESMLNLARSYIHAGKKNKALPVLEEVCENHPNKPARIFLLNTYIELGNIGKAQNLLETCLAEYPDSINVKFCEAQINWLTKKRKLATDQFDALLKGSQNTEMMMQIGKIYNINGFYEKAKNVLEKGFALKQEDVFINHQLGFALLRLGDFETALEHFFKVIDSFYFFAKAHLYIGECLYRLGYFEQAGEAWELAATMAPNNALTRRWLVKLYSEYILDAQKAAFHQAKLPDLSKQIVVVSGLPRSGTSMMMQMLQAGGKSAYTDATRAPDNNNPHGYFEHEKVKSLANNASWLYEAEGKSIKIIAQLLPFLPPKHSYKIIFMEREISEVLVSQQLMRGKSREEAIKNYPFKLAQTYFEQLERVANWVEDQPNVAILRINYLEAVLNPASVAQKIDEFLDDDLNLEAMTQAVDENLYRNQSL